MNRKTKKLWTEAYESAHVAADLTAKGHDGKEVDLTWLRGVAASLWHTVALLQKSQPKTKPQPKAKS